MRANTPIDNVIQFCLSIDVLSFLRASTEVVISPRGFEETYHYISRGNEIILTVIEIAGTVRRYQPLETLPIPAQSMVCQLVNQGFTAEEISRECRNAYR